jgi:hypothetical protein
MEELADGRNGGGEIAATADKGNVLEASARSWQKADMAISRVKCRLEAQMSTAPNCCRRNSFFDRYR